jgi:hypothetical protein
VIRVLKGGTFAVISDQMIAFRDAKGEQQEILQIGRGGTIDVFADGEHIRYGDGVAKRSALRHQILTDDEFIGEIAFRPYMFFCSKDGVVSGNNGRTDYFGLRLRDGELNESKIPDDPSFSPLHGMDYETGDMFFGQATPEGQRVWRLNTVTGKRSIALTAPQISDIVGRVPDPTKTFRDNYRDCPQLVVAADGTTALLRFNGWHLLHRRNDEMKRVQELKLTPTDVRGNVFFTEGGQVAAIDRSLLELYDDKGKLLDSIDKKGTRWIAVTSDGVSAFGGIDNQRLVKMNIQTGESEYLMNWDVDANFGGRFNNRMAVSRSTPMVALVGQCEIDRSSDFLRIIDLREKTVIRTIKSFGRIEAVDFGPDGKSLIILSDLKQGKFVLHQVKFGE